MDLFSKVFAAVFSLMPASKRWRYRLEEDFCYYSETLKGIYFDSQWFVIRDGDITVKAGYAWDGVTPAFYFLGVWWGVWDGPKGKDKKPCSWKATVVHDAMCQFIGLIKGISKDQTVEVFKELLKINTAPKFMVSLYPKAVKYFGPQDWS